MPEYNTITYKVKDDIYDIPEDKAEAFESRYPDATQEYRFSNGDIYDIPLFKREAFEKWPEYVKDREKKIYDGLKNNVSETGKDIDVYTKIAKDRKEWWDPNTKTIYGGSVGLPVSTMKLTKKAQLLDSAERFNRASKNVIKWVDDMNAGGNAVMRNADVFMKGVADESKWIDEIGYQDAKLRNDILEKYDRGEELSQEEQVLLNAMINYEASQYQFNKLGFWAGAARGAAESVPFMLDFLLTGRLAKGISKAAIRGLEKYSRRALGKGIASGIAKATAKGAGKNAKNVARGITEGVGASALMTGTIQGYDTMADAKNRMTGDVNIGYDEDGNAIYEGRENYEKDMPSAVKKAFKSGMIENYSEMVFDALKPLTGSIGGLFKNSKVGISIANSKAGRMFENITSGDLYKWASRVKKETGIDNYFTENLEEVFGGLANAWLVGDNSVSDVFSAENLLQTAAVTGIIQAGFVPIKGGGAAVDMAIVAGEKRKLRRERDKAFANLSDVFGKDEAEKLDALFQEKSMEENIKALNDAKNSGEYADEQIKAITDYFVNQTAYDAMVSASRKKIEEGAKAVFEEARSYVNRESGMEQVVALKGEEEEFYVTTGNLVFDENGKVDEKLSSVSITVKDRKGNKKMISPSDVDSLISYKSPEQAEISAHQEEQRAYDAMIREESRVVDAEDPNIGDVIRLKDDKGNEVDAVVQRRDADGKYILTTFEKGSVQDGRLSGEEIPSGSMLLSANEIDARRIDDPGEIVQEENDGNDVAGEIASEYQPSALERIPKDENGQPIYEQTDSNTAWDAILEQTEGDEAMAQNVADGMVAEKESELNKLERTKSKGGVSVAEKIAAEKERKYRIDAAKKQLSVWKSIADTANRRKIEAESERRRQAEEQAKAMRAEQERMKAEQEEAARIEREALNGVPDIVNDTPKDARSRGYRRVNGHKIDRQEPVGHLQGKEVAVRFSDDTTAKARVAVMEANQLQPSHIQGQRNPAHFIDEAQPKERNDAASVMSARKIAWNMRPEEITTSVTAYTGAPTVNTRGEVIQGNNRSAALRLMWESEKDKAADYKKYLKDHAEEFGLNSDEIEAMQNPVLVNMLDVEDAEAIGLGQYVAQDTESGGTERIKPKNAVQRMGKEMRTFANLLLKSADDETTFAGLVDRNAEEVLRWMNQRGYITPTQYASAFDSKGTLTAEAKNDLKSIMYQSIFQGGSTRLEQMFNAMPAKAQKAILATAFRDYDSQHSERMVGEIQNSIMAYNALSQDAVFASAKNWKEARMAVEGWKRQYYMDDVTGESYLPADKFSNFALHLATMYKGESQGLIQKTFNRIYDLIQGTQEETLFEKPDNTPRTLAQAIYETLNIQYDGQLRSDVLAGNRTAGKRGRQESNGNAASGERVENGNGTADRAGSIESESTTGSEVGHTHSLLDVIRILYSKGKETASKLFQRSFFDVAQTPKFMQELGLRGDKFTIKYGVIARHIGKDSSHTLTERDWEQLPQALQKPFAISKLSDKEDSYRIYTTLQTESGEFVVVGADVKNVGREIEVNAISTVFGRRNNANLPKNEEVIYRSNEITPEQSSLLERPNFAQYPTEQELFADKDTNIYTNNNELYDYNALLEVENAESELATRLGEPIDELEEQIDNGIKHETRQVYHIDGNPDKAIVWVSRWEDNDPGNKKSEQFFEYKGRNIGDEVEAVLKAVDLATNVADAESEINTNPTEAQKEAGNFKKGHVQIGTFDVTIENPKGSVRSGVDANGNKWETTMNNSYGYIRGTEGVDGDHIDVFLADDIYGWNGREVFVIDQYNEDGTFDEHKVMIGFNDEADAYAAYLANYESGWADSRKIVCSSVNIEDFEKWIDSSHRKTKPFAEYKTVAKESKTVGEISTETEPSNADGYLVERRFHKKNGTYIHAVKFTEQMPRERFMELKKRVKDFGGYYSSFGKGGFIFNTEEDARKFAEAVLDKSGELLENSEPVTLSETRKFIDQTIEKQGQETTQSKQEETNTDNNPSGNRLVTDERYEELKKRMRAKLGQLNVGIDPEILAIGTEMAVYHIEKGARKFAEYAKAMIADLGDVVRPYLKSFYNGARDLPEVADSGMANDMTLYDDVRIFDVANFDKDHTDPFATAENTVAEQEIGRQAAEAKKEIISKRNTERRKENEQTTADTEVIASQAEAIASQAESDIEAATDERQINEIAANIDTQIEKVNEQLALLGYYEAEFDDKDFNEAYGYMRNAEKKAVKDANSLAKRLVKDLGITPELLVDNKGKRIKNFARANIAPAGGDVTITLPLMNGRELKVYISLEPTSAERGEDYIHSRRGDNLYIEHIMFRVENPEASGYERYGNNQWIRTDADYEYMLRLLKYEARDFLPKVEAQESNIGETVKSNETKSFNGYKVGDKVLYTPSQRSGKPVEAVIHDFENEGEHRPVLDTGLAPILYEVVDWGDIKPITQKETIEKPSKTHKKSVSSQKKMTDLFGGLFDNENLTEKEEENGLQRNDEVSSERLSADSDRYEERLSEGIERGSDVKTEESRGIDPGREGGSDAVDRTVRPRSSGSVTTSKNTRNNHSERGENHAPSSVDARIDANIKAIELANQLIENGETATPEQMAILRKFSGWGGLGKAFNDANISQRLQEILGAEGLEQAIMSANSAYYTPAYVIDTLWDIAEKMGFEGGNILEGSAGIGNILGQMPTRISERSDIHAVEIDRTSGGILSLLYPDAKVEIQGFEQTRIQNGSVDLAITNVPFVTGLRVDDTTGDKDLSKKFHNIHDFCIAKNVRKLREGGIGIFISSNGTLDNSKKLRDWIVNEGGSDFVGAFRMNNKTFVGTSVTSDIIVIRKRVNGRKSPYAIDVSAISGERTAEYDTGDSRKIKGVEVPVIKQLAMDYNRYFIEHPENMAGSMRFAFEEGETFRPTSKGLYPTKGKDQEKMLAEFVNGFSGKDWQEETSESAYSESYNFVADASAVGRKVGEMYVKDGNIVIASLGGFYPLDVNANKVKGHTKVECFNAYSAIKEALADVLEYQINNESDSGLKPLLDRLNKAYDDFVSTYGHFNKNTAIAFLRNDVDYPNIFSLERYEEIGDKTGNRVQKFGKTDVFSRRVVEREKEPTPTNVKDGIIASVFKFGRIDIPYIAEQLGENTEDVKRDIIENKYGFENPATRQIEVSYLYLSGNVREKLRQAQENNENGIYDGNIKALQKIMPMDIPAHLIDFTLGSSWIDPKLYEEYVLERTDIPVSFTTAGGTWFMAAPDYGFNKEKNRSMGVVSDMLHKTIFGHTLIEAAIQNRTITVSQTNRKWDGTTETIIDKEATQACAAKIDEIRQDFKEWARQKMQNDSDMSARMERIYNDTFNNYVPMSIPDEFVPEYFGGASHRFKMRPHQGKAIVRGTMQPLMLAHEVGTGKTFTLISTAMEMRRLGTARKPMIVVQNATVGQFVASAKELYPNAKILTLDESDRSAEGRKNFYAKIRYNDWDMIVVPQSTFEFIPDSEERQMAYIQDKIEEKKLVLEQMRDADPSGQSMITRQAQREIDQLEDQLAGIADEASKKRNAADQKKRAVSLQNAEVRAKEMLDRRTDDVENFDDMGIDALLVDEAHEYKHLGFSTAMQRGVKGIDPSYSKKSQGVYLKTQAVLEKNNGRNVIFATGTPISNTAAEIWTFMRYLMPADTMSEYGIYYFDDFVRNFGNIQQMLEFTTSGKFKENNRFAGYVNLPELVRIWSGVSDTVLTREAGGVSDKIPDMEGGKAQDIYLPQTRALRGIMKFVKAQLDRYEKMSGKEKKENSHIPLTMYGIAKAAAVDARLVQADAEDDPNSKTNEAVRQTIRSLKETESYKGTVAIFADNYQNKQSGFNLYDDIRDKLIAESIPAEQVVIMRSGMTIKKKLEIFDKVNRGEIRVILGSTFTLGTGVNIQERLHTLIHLDAPNRPMDYTQRNGRILRQGNLHKSMGRPVRILRFGVEDSLDVTAYQRLKTKGSIADSIMDGKRMMANSMSNRVLEEEEDVFGDTVAQLSGSEYALLKNNAEKNVRKYESRKKQWETDQTYIHNAKPRLKGQIAKAEHMADINRGYLRKVKEVFPNGTFTKITAGNQTFADMNDMADLFKEHNKKVLDKMKQMKEGGESSHVRELTVSLGGFVFKMSTELNKEMTRGGGKLFSEVHRKMTYSCSELGLENVPVKQGLLRNAIEDITKNVITGKDYSERIESAERSAENARSELKQLQQREGKPFEFDKELEEAKKQYAEYSELMKKELEEKEAKYAEMDTSVDDANNIYINEDDEVLYRSDDYTTKDRIEDLFNLAISGEFRGKPISIGTLTDEGKAYLEQISGVSFKDKVDFVLNPSDLIHIYNRHFGENEKDGRNIPLDIEDIRSIVDIISNPDRVIYSVEVGQQGRKMFSFLKEAEHGTYNLLEIYSDKKGNLTAKSFYKSKEGVSQRVISLTRTLHSTSETDGATLNDVAKIPQMFDTSISEDENLRDDDRLKEVNERFNEELQRQMDGTLPKGHVYGLGRPSDALLSAGMPDLPIEMASARLLHKSNQYNHPFELSEVKNMPQAIQNPMAVFRSATHVGSNVILTELRQGNKNFVVAIETNRQQGKIKVNSVRSIHPRTVTNIVDWINNGLMDYVDKKQLHEWLLEKIKSRSYLNSSNPADVKKQLDLATNIVESFEKPTTEQGKIVSAIENLARELNTPVTIIRNVDEITDSDRKREHKKRGSKGWFDPVTGDIFLVLPNATSVADAQTTVLHEAVGHKGLRGLLGDRFNNMLDRVYDSLPDYEKERIDEAVRKGWFRNRRTGTEEYLASIAETDVRPSVWNRIKGAIRDFFRRLGISLRMGDADIKYMLWRSRNRLMNMDDPFEVADIVSRNFRMLEKLENEKAMEETAENIPFFRDGEETDENTLEIRDVYNHIFSSYKKKGLVWKTAYLTENFQDRYYSLKRIQELIVENSGRKLASHENAHEFSSQIAGINQAEMNYFNDTLLRALTTSIADLTKKGNTYEDITNYMHAKHGLERNRKMREDALERAIRNDEIIKELEGLSQQEDIADEVKKGYEQEIETRKQKIMERTSEQTWNRDYAGLTALYEEALSKDESISDILNGDSPLYEQYAEYLVDKFEAENGKDAVDRLWKSVRDANAWTLKKRYESGLLTRSEYDKVKGMYEYYIPLRGFDDDTADDIYQYMTNSRYNLPDRYKRTEGRTSKHEDPISVMAKMAETAITSGNRNIFKQKVLNMVLNHPTDLFTLGNVWYVNVGTKETPEWIISLPEFPQGATAEQMREISDNFEKDMQQKQKEGTATRRKGKVNLDVFSTARQDNEHTVFVKQNGIDYVIYVNGNPRVAQAINGTNVHEQGDFAKVVSEVNRFLAKKFTVQSPSFVLTNFVRDYAYSVIMSWVKNDAGYARRVAGRIFYLMPAIARAVKGKADMSKETDRMFREFVENGGETGFFKLFETEDYKRMIKRQIRDIEKPGNIRNRMLSVWKAVISPIEIMNRIAEDSSRFAVYYTSRKEGKKDVQSAISDAKEITVNFNKRGSNRGIASYVSGLYIFFNAAVQSLANIGETAKKYPKKLLTVLGGHFLAGFMAPMLNALLLDDDELEAYFNLPEYVRRSNICLWAGDEFITITLSIELRAFYGMGDALYTYLSGRCSGEDFAYSMMDQITELLPLNPFSQEGLRAFIPSAVKPVAEVIANTSFTGRKVYPDMYNDNLPEYRRVYAGTGDYFVKVSEFLNDISGGDQAEKGYINVNPAVVEHLVEGYLGGAYKFYVSDTGKSLSYLLGSRDNLESRNIPALNRFINDSHKWYRYSKEREEYERNTQEYNSVNTVLKIYRKDLKEAETSDERTRIAKKIADFRTKHFETIEKFHILKGDEIEDRMNELRRNGKSMTDSEYEKAREKIYELQREFNENYSNRLVDLLI